MSRFAFFSELVSSFLLLPLAWVWRRLAGRNRPVVVQGWLGSETVGDVAILGQVLREWSLMCPERRQVVVSFRPEISSRSLEELGLKQVAVVPAGLRGSWCQLVSEVLVFCGGPLMESKAMPLWAVRGALARWVGSKVVIHGCGIGPVRSQWVRRSIHSLLGSCREILLRDAESLQEVPSGLQPMVGFDPAFDYVRRWKSPREEPTALGPPRVALFLRYPPRSYLNLAAQEWEASCQQFVRTMAATLDRLGGELKVEWIGLVMHGDFVESDDHEIYRAVREQMKSPERLTVKPGHHPLSYVLEELEASRAALAVRFHGMIFSLARGKPFVAIDYTVPRGKVSAAATECGALHRVIPWQDLDSELLLDRLRAACQEGEGSSSTPSQLGDPERARLDQCSHLGDSRGGLREGRRASNGRRAS